MRRLQYLYGLQVDDLDALKAVYNSNTKNIFDYSLLLHEEAFLKYWLDQDVPLINIIDLNFFATNYPKLGPPAHREGIIAEYNLISYYARSIGYRYLSKTALALVNPFVDEAGDESKIWQERFANNPEFYTKCPSRKELERAISVYSRGGYVYKESEEQLIQLNRSNPISTRHVPSFPAVTLKLLVT
jgi:hypothetical protein